MPFKGLKLFDFDNSGFGVCTLSATTLASFYDFSNLVKDFFSLSPKCKHYCHMPCQFSMFIHIIDDRHDEIFDELFNMLKYEKRTDE